MENLWRVNLKTDGSNNQIIKKFCFNKGVIAMGWPIYFDTIPTKEEYFKAAENYNYSGGYKSACINILDKMKVGDLCISRDNTYYYVGKICSDPFYAINEELRLNNFSWVRNVEWRKIGKQDETPAIIVGVLSESRQKTFDLKSKNQEIFKVSNFVFEKLINTEFKLENKLILTKENFANMLYYENLENIVGFYLQERYNLLFIPKSGKKILRSLSLY